MKQKVSASVAVVVIVVAAAIFLVVFSRASLAPPEEEPIMMPEAPTAESRDLARAREGLRPLGITGVMPALPEDRLAGVRVASVAADSPAERAGIRVGDLITSFDGDPLVDALQLAQLLRDVEQGRTYEVEVVRDREPQTLEVRGVQSLLDAASGSGGGEERGEEATNR
jgi:membrane-associated protease RseP (regulator of RpoE activity)